MTAFTTSALREFQSLMILTLKVPDIKSVLSFENLPIVPSGLTHIIAGVAELEEHLTRHTV